MWGATAGSKPSEPQAEIDTQRGGSGVDSALKTIPGEALRGALRSTLSALPEGQ